MSEAKKADLKEGKPTAEKGLACVGSEPAQAKGYNEDRVKLQSEN